MRRPVARASLLAFIACVSPAAADPIDTHTDVGALAAVVAGTHVGSENPNPVQGVVPGALLEVTQHVGRFRLHLEGLPQISASASGAGKFGTTSATLSLLNAVAFVDVDKPQRLRLGFGIQIVNVNNFNGNNGDVDQSRVSSPIYAVGATLPAARGHFVELGLLLEPNLRGAVHIFHGGATSEPDKPEAGAEVDYSAAYGWRRGRMTYLLGGRGLSYHTRNLRNGELVDRNVGGGVTFEARYSLGGPGP